MEASEKAVRCAGCVDDFYNGKNPMGVKECWSLPTAKLVQRVRVPLNQAPPWRQAPDEVYNCRREKGMVLLTIESVAANNAACERAGR